MKKIIFIVSICLVLVAILCLTTLPGCVLVSGIIVGPAISINKMERIFIEDYELLSNAVHCLIEIKDLEYDSIYIDDTMKNGEISNAGKHVEIKDIEMIKVINTLKRKGYKIIHKNENVIRFERWSRFENERGIVYSIDGSKPSDDAKGIQFLIESVPLSEPNWYYYEADYNEWRVHN